jgi:hypothetical protein
MQKTNRQTIERRVALTVAAAVLMALVAAQASHALVGDIGTNHLTFSRPVALPGVVLTAGTYTFERTDANRHVVRVTSRDRRTTYFLGFTQEVRRPRTLPADQAVVFGEAAAGTAHPIRTWYPVGSATGNQFIYW